MESIVGRLREVRGDRLTTAPFSFYPSTLNSPPAIQSTYLPTYLPASTI
ncbi:hypothetical protein QP591_08885 [Aerococcus urinae]|nr:hypothetical protein [Aerococcus urinae]